MRKDWLGICSLQKMGCRRRLDWSRGTKKDNRELKEDDTIYDTEP